MPSRIKDEVFAEIREYELEGCPSGWTISDYIQAVVEDIDPEIRGFVQELQLLGYPTYTSCAGGPGHCTVTSGMGFVTITQNLVPDEVREIKKVARRCHLTGVRVSPGSPSKQVSRILFNPIGGKPHGH